MPHISLRLTGKTGQIDGYAEMLLGMFMMAGLKKYAMNKKTRQHGITQIYMELDVVAPPLGHVGESDIPEREDDPE